MDVSETLFQAVDILIDKKIEAVKFDKTIEATVENANNANNGQYTVSSGAAKFIAYSYDTQYKENDVVLVTIPQGNFDNQKIIIGKKVSEMNESMGYQSPFQNFINISNNLITTQTFFTPMQANSHNADYTWPIEETNFTVLNYIWCADYSNTPLQGYTRLGLQAQFLTYLADYNTTSGNYGLALKITFQEISSGKIQSSFVFLDSNSFLGNPYNFETYYTQEEVFDISAFKEYPIVRLDLYQYQRDNFKDNEGQFIPSSTEDDFSSIPSNIFIKDIMICVGYPVENFKNDIAELYTENTLTYDKNYNYYSYYISAPRNNTTALYLQHGGVLYWSTTEPNKDSDLVLYTDDWTAFETNYISQSNPGYFYKKKVSNQIENGAIFITFERVKHNKKIIQLRWIHKNNDGVIKALTYDDNFDTEYEIRWYRHHLGAASPDEFAGAHWDRFYGVAAAANDNEDWADYSFIPIQFSEDNINSTNGEYKRFVTYTPRLEESEEDEYGNTHWEEVGIDIDTIKFSATGATTVYEIKNGKWILVQVGEQTELDKIYYLKIDNVSSYSEGYDIATNQLQIEFIPNVNYQTEQLKAIILEKINDNSYKKLIETNILVFTNNDEVRSEATVLDVNALSIKYDDEDNYRGNFYVYNHSNQLESKLLSNPRKLIAVFDYDEQDIYKKAELSDFTSITWYFPRNRTMIITTESDSDSSNSDFIVIKNNRNYINYQIKQTLDLNAVNNTVRLEVLKDGQLFTAYTTMYFGENGLNGSPYTFYVVWDDNNNILNLASNKTSLSGKIFLKDSSTISQFDSNYSPVISASWHTFETQNPNINNVYEVKKMDSCYLPILAPEDTIFYNNGSSNGPTYYISQNESSGADTYYYDFNTCSFIKITNETDEIDQKYYLYDGYSLPEFEFSTVVFEESPIDVDTGEVHDQGTDSIVTGNNTFYYSSKKKFFIKYKDTYILDPWDTYNEAETYYYPKLTGRQVIENTQNIPFTVTIEHFTGQYWPITIEYTNNSAENDIHTLLILQLTLSNFGDYNLVRNIPIILSNLGEKEKITDLLATTEVRYDTSGMIDYMRLPYRIGIQRDKNNFTHDILTDTLQGYWKLLILPELEHDNFEPILRENRSLHENENIQWQDGKFDVPSLEPVSIYIPQARPYGVQFYYQYPDIVEEGQPQTYSEKCILTVPILTIENNYPLEALNKWNGKEIITDEENGTIVAKGFSAGKKESDNTFSGVVIGDWSRDAPNTLLAKNTGVYGFDHGAMSYAFKDDGTGFIGKDGRGRIFFDGEKSQIFSSGWVNQNKPQGMLLDIDDGYIKMVKNTQQYTYTHISNDIAKNKYFKGNGQTFNSSINLFYYNNSSYTQVEQGDVYNASYSYYKQEETESSDKYITLGVNQERYPLSIGMSKNINQRKFRVGWDGTAYIQSGQFEGVINGSSVYANYLSAGAGQIGGWTINGNSLSGGSTVLSSASGISTNSITINGLSSASGTIGQIRSGVSGSTEVGVGIQVTQNDVESDVKITPSNAAISYQYGTVNGTVKNFISCQNDGTHITGTQIILTGAIRIGQGVQSLSLIDYINGSTLSNYVKASILSNYVTISDFNALKARVDDLDGGGSSGS